MQNGARPAPSRMWKRGLMVDGWWHQALYLVNASFLSRHMTVESGEGICVKKEGAHDACFERDFAYAFFA